MLILKDICKTFNKNTINENRVFTNLNLTVEEGEFISIVGSNGAGKSTLLNCIAGVIKIDEGLIKLDGRDITSLDEYKRSKFIGRVFQDPLLGTSPSMTIEENLSMAFSRSNNLSLKWGLNSFKKKLFKSQLSRLNLGLEKRLETKVKFLSGGQRQALTLLMATMVKPKILLLDEHTASLDPATAIKINSLTKEIINEGRITTLMITHNLEHAIKMGDRLIMMHRGRVLLDIKDNQKKQMSVSKLLKMFEQAQGEKFMNDRSILALQI